MRIILSLTLYQNAVISKTAENLCRSDLTFAFRVTACHTGGILKDMNIEGLAVHSLANELDHQLAGGRIMKIFQPTRFLFMFKIRLPENEITLAISMEPADPRVHTTIETRENPIEPSSLCMYLRKHLVDGRIASVTQQAGLDRVLHIQIDLREGQGRILTRTLTLELAGKNSNLILTENGVIMDALRRVGFNTSRVRQIVPGGPYIAPPTKPRLNPMESEAEEVTGAMSSLLDLSAAKALMSVVDGIGPLGVKEVLFRSGVNEKTIVRALSPEQWKKISLELRLFVEPMKTFPTTAFVAMDSVRRLIAVANFEPRHLAAPILEHFSSLNAAISFAASLSAAPKTTLQNDTIRRVNSELDKLERKLELLKHEWSESQNADLFRRQADLLMANLQLLTPSLKQICVFDVFCESDCETGSIIQPTLEIILYPALSPMENIQRYYKKYSRAKRAQELIHIQINQCKEDIQYLEGIQLSLGELVSGQETQEIIQELAASGYIQAGRPPRSLSKPSEPRKLTLESGATIYIGRNNRQNDHVTFKLAQPRDLWFHTKDIPGSHVLLRSNGNSPLATDNEKAAMLAAWFSKARHSANVPVDFTERRHVKKPSGAKPGFVIYEKQKTVWVTTDATTIAELLLEKISR